MRVSQHVLCVCVLALVVLSTVSTDSPGLGAEENPRAVQSAPRAPSLSTVYPAAPHGLVHLKGPEPRLSTPSAAPAAGSDWDTFRYNVQRTAANPVESTLAPGNITGMVRLWSYSTGGVIEGSPTVVGDRVFVGSWDGYEYALNASNGALVWKTFLGTTSGTCTSYGPAVGITSSPAVLNGTLFVGGGDSYWYALNAANGSVLGRVFVGQTGSTGGYYNWASPLIVGGAAYIGLASECDNPLVQGGLLMVNISDPSTLGSASILHRFNSVPSGYTGGSIWGTPSYDPSTNTVFVATGNYGSYTGSYTQAIIALNASDLAVRSAWQILNTPNGDSDFSSGPLVFNDSHGNHLVVAANKDGFDYAVNASNVHAGPVWSQPVANPRCGFPPAAFDGERLYLTGMCTTVGSVTYAGSVRAVLPDNRTAWVHYTPGFVIGGASYADGLVLDAALNESSSASGFRVNSTVEILNASTGDLLRSLSFPGEAVNSTLTVADGRVYIGLANESSSRDGRLVAYGIPLSVAVATSGGGTNDSGVVQFSANITGGSPGETFAWAFGDGTSGVGARVSHTYFARGNYTVHLAVVDALGDQANWTGTVSVWSAPSLTVLLAATPLSGLSPLTVTATASVSGGVAPYRYAWRFGDGQAANASSSVDHAYLAPGSYALSVMVTDANGANGSATAKIVVAPPLTVAASVVPLTGPVPFTANFSSTVSGGFPPFTGTWQFGDGAAGVPGLGSTHTYVSVGTFTVVFSVRDSQGDTASDSLLVTTSPRRSRPTSRTRPSSRVASRTGKRRSSTRACREGRRRSLTYGTSETGSPPREVHRSSTSTPRFRRTRSRSRSPTRSARWCRPGPLWVGRLRLVGPRPKTGPRRGSPRSYRSS